MTSNDIAMTAAFTEDSLFLYDRAHNSEAVPAQTLRRISGDTDAFVVKYGPDGKFKWSAQMNGHNLSEGLSTSLDTTGSVCVAGYFADASLNIYQGSRSNTDTAALANILFPEDISTNNVFLVKYSNTGVYNWGVSIGPNVYCNNGYYPLTSIANTASHQTLISTCFQGSNISLFRSDNTTACTFEQTDSSGNVHNVLLAKYSTDGNLLWGARIDGVGDSLIRNHVTVDLNGNSYVAMFNRNNNYSTFYVYNGYLPTIGSTYSNGHLDADASFNYFYDENSSGTLVKFNSDGVYQWNVQIGLGLNSDSVNLTTAQDGSVYMIGTLDTGSSNVEFYDSFVNLSQNQQERGAAISINNISTMSQTVAGQYKMFVAKYNSDGVVQWANLMTGDISGVALTYSEAYGNGGGNHFLGGYSIAADGHGNCFGTGYFSDRFTIRQPFVRGSHDAALSIVYNTISSHRQADTGFDSSNVDNNAFVVSFDPMGVYRWVVPLHNKDVRGCSVAVDVNNQIVVSGYFGYYRNSLYIGDPIPFKYPLNTPAISQNCYVLSRVGYYRNNYINYFVAKLNAKGKTLWANQMGATNLIPSHNFAVNPVATNNITTKHDV